MNIKISKATACSLVGIFGVAVTGILAFRAGRRSVLMPKPENETKKEKAVRVAKTYGPSVAAGAVTCASILAGDRMHVKAEAALGAAAVMWKDGYLNLEKATEKVVGKEKVEEINNTVKEQMQPEVVDEKDQANLSNTIKVYEPFTGQFIWTTREMVAWTMLEANKKLQKDLLCKLNVIITGIGGKATPEGEEWRWDYESETLDYNWGFYNMGPWIDIQLIPKKHGPEMVLELYYTVEPVKPVWEDKLYRESN